MLDSLTEKEGDDALIKGKVGYMAKTSSRVFKFINRLGSEKLKYGLTWLVKTGRIK